MSKKLTKHFRKLDARIKDWNATQARIVTSQNKTNPRAYRKPGSMKGRS